jgi:hypothetical protein
VVRPIFLNAFTREPRLEMIAHAQRAIAASGGWILDHHFYSNLAISISFEIADARAGDLLENLQATGLRLSSESVAALDSVAEDVERLGSRKATDIQGFLHITFVHDEPDLRREVPAIPG